MGDFMTKLNQTAFAPETLPSDVPHAFSLPVAPLTMPMQVLEPDNSILQLLASPIAACFEVLRHGFRRAG
jgi:hypothetical protein